MLHIILRSLLFISIIAFNPINLFGQDATLKKIDEATKAQLTVAGFCLCDTKLSDLKTLSDDFAETVVEEMDLPKNCYGQDSRFTSGKGIYYEADLLRRSLHHAKATLKQVSPEKI